MSRLDLNKKFLDERLGGRINLDGMVRVAYLIRGERPELVLIYKELPAYERPGLGEIMDMSVGTGNIGEICSLGAERRFRFKKIDVVITTVEAVKADEEYVEDRRKLLENEAFCMYAD